MDDFLDALTPAMREQVEAALREDPDARMRLTSTVSRYVDTEGNWPEDPATSQMLAEQFLHVHGVETRVYAPAGLSPAVTGALAGGATALVQAGGAYVIGSWAIANYWQNTVSYATGLQPEIVKAMFGAFKRMSAGTRWEKLANDLTVPNDPPPWAFVFGDAYEQILKRELTGSMKKAAWRGSRSAINHTTGVSIPSFGLLNPWAEDHVSRFARQQAELSGETARGIVQRAQEQGLSPRALAQRLRDQWMLTPRYSQAVDNHRKGLIEQGMSAQRVIEQTQRYTARLRDSRVTAIAQTEALTTFHLAREAQWIRAVNDGTMPLDTMKMWVTAKDELVCKVCRPMDGVTAPLGVAFQGTVTLLAPTAHPNCRCIIIPVTGAGVADVSRGQRRLVFPAQEAVSKHLVGRHDQKKHGNKHSRKDHPTGFGNRVAQMFSEEQKWEDLKTSEKAATSLAAAYGTVGIISLGAMAAFPAGRAVMRQVDLASLRMPATRAMPKAPLSTTAMPKMKDWERFTFDIEDLLTQTKIKVKRTTAESGPKDVELPLHLGFAQVRSSLMRKAGYLTPAPGLDAAYHGSVVSNSGIQGMQYAADEVFDLKAATQHFKKRSKAQIDQDDTFDGLGWKPYVSTQSEMMSQMLKRVGVTEVPVARGMKMTARQARAMGIDPIMKRSDLASKGWQTTQVPLQPLSSFTTDPDVARQFATGVTPSGAGDTLAFIMRRKVGAEEVFSNFSLGPGSSAWDEWVIKGGTKDWDVIAVNPRLLRDDGFFEQLWDSMPSSVGKHLGPDKHPSGSSQDVHSGEGGSGGSDAASAIGSALAGAGFVNDEELSPAEAATMGVVGVAGALITRGKVRSYGELIGSMRTLNRAKAAPLQRLDNGAITNFSVRDLDVMTEGYGFRLGNQNHINNIANAMMRGEDVFTHGGKTNPIMVLVYKDGAQVLDGKHRLAAARQVGMDNVPIQIAKVDEAMPSPTTYRQHWDELRRQRLRSQLVGREDVAPRVREFWTRSQMPWERRFNDWMTRRSAAADEDRFAALGVTRGVAKHMGPGPHPSGTEQSIHSGGEEDEPWTEKGWDFAAYALSRGEVRDRSELNATMRKRNRRASKPLRQMRNGKITNFSTRQLGFMTEGYGFRLGNTNHVNSFANRMMAGEDLFRFRGRRDPVMVLVYTDGAQVLDGKHRLAAAQKAGVRKVPVQVAKINKPMPAPDSFRQEWDELRRNLVRYQYANSEIPRKPDKPFKTRKPRRYERTFNEWMTVRSALRDEERFLELGVERGTKPKRRFRRSA